MPTPRASKNSMRCHPPRANKTSPVMHRSNHHFRHLFMAVLTCTGIGGCDDPEPDESTFRDGVYQCPRWKCGSNTSEVNGKSLQELHLGGQPNADGVPLRGTQLIGSLIWLQLDGSISLPVVIAGYEEVDSWAANGEPVAAYALTYADLAQPLLTRSVCKGTLIDPLQAAVVVLAGERYDLDDKTVIPNQTNWITLACAGSAAAKMALLGYGPHAEFTDSSQPASVDRRQATLSMITANYCDDGDSYTEDGTLLAWENQSGTVTPEGEVGELEAIWTQDGAICLDVPRLVDREDVACPLPTCEAFSLEDGEWATYVVEN
jgi:hypothetical protein